MQSYVLPALLDVRDRGPRQSDALPNLGLSEASCLSPDSQPPPKLLV
jgi:hypothetical protein